MFTFKYFLYATQIILIFYSIEFSYGLTKYDKKDLENLREEVRQMFQHAYDGYLKYAYPYDELRPLSCDGVDTWGSYSLTLIDALDTLAVMGNYTEFQRVVNIVTANANFDANINVSVFETNIRIIGGLLSAHLMSHRAGVTLVPGWPCNGPLLQLAEDVARRLIAAFDTPTGMPYGTVNLRHGVPEGETTVTCTAGAGTFIVEFGALSRLTGDPLFEEVAMRALDALHHYRSPIGLVGNHIDVATGRWTAQDAGIGAGVDSYYEYLAKGAILLQRPELMHMFDLGKAAIEKYLKRDDWHLWVSMSKGQVTLPVFQSLEAYWPGVLSLIGDVNKGVKSLHNYHQVWKQYGFTPEFYYIPQGEAGINRESYPLRPELIESVMYLYRATGDPFLLDVGRDILRSIQHSAKTPCGYATIKDVRDHRKEDRMESFFLAETTKYLYLLFDPDNFIHNRGQSATVVQTPWGECLLETGGYIFNTEAHPIDPAALHCCSGPRPSDIQATFHASQLHDMRGVPLAKHKGSGKPSLSNGRRSTKLPTSEPAAAAVAAAGPEVTQPSTSTSHATQPLPTKTHVTQEAPVVQPPAANDVSQLPVQKPPRPDLPGNTILLAQLHKKLSTPKEMLAQMQAENQLRLSQFAMDRRLERLIDELGGAISGLSNSKSVPAKDSTLRTGDEGEEAKSLGRDKVQEGSADNQEKSDSRITEKSLHDLKKENIELGNLQSIIKNELYKLSIAQLGVDNDEVLTNNQEPKSKDDEIVVKDRNRGVVVNAQEPEGYGGKWEHESDSGQIRKDVKPSGYVARTKKDPLLEYRADDSDRVYPVGGQAVTNQEHGACTDDWAWHHTPDSILPDFVEQYLLNSNKSKKTKRFDPQALFERMQTENKYIRNVSWAANYEILSCAAQPFVQRLSMSGEMFDTT